jgi:arylsulfatase A-like enzyme
VPTPNIQALAEGGVVFRQAFCAAPTCSPSRAALLTGQCPHNNGMFGLAHFGFSLDDYNRHIIHTLREVGYYSALIGVQHITEEPEIIGYDKVTVAGNLDAKSAGKFAAEFLRDAPSQPFFLSVGTFETHRDFPQTDPQDQPQYTRPPQPIPDTPKTRADFADFKKSARLFDDGVGSVLEALEQSGLADNTLVICTTDHGIAFPGMKCTLTDHGIGVMLIMRGPGGFDGGKVCDAMVSHIDVYPTICDLLGITPPDWLQGKSMMPLIRRQAEEINEEIFSEVTYHAAYEPKRGVRTSRYKYIRRFGDRTKPVMPNCDDSAAKDVWLEHGWRERPVAQEQLYDLVFDPTESNNLAKNPAAREQLQEMRQRLDRWMQKTGDPLLKGPVPLPAGAVANDPDEQSLLEPSELSKFPNV